MGAILHRYVTGG